MARAREPGLKDDERERRERDAKSLRLLASVVWDTAIIDEAAERKKNIAKGLERSLMSQSSIADLDEEGSPREQT